ncbi:MAG: hypothetical protein A4E48_00301 [Methanosaeta sp. PtaU1.Bin060]|nr:MAG: hypothetical protein A4E48_00301 [Methanosaeta sp. PtaU1.Bin060]
MGFATVADFETALSFEPESRIDHLNKSSLLREGLMALISARDEPQVVIIDDGPIDPENPDGPHNTHEEPATNSIWRQFGFESIDDVITMIERFEEAMQ